MSLKKIESRLAAIETTLAVNTEHLDQHMKRTELAEERLTLVENRIFGALLAFTIALSGAIVTFLLKK